MLNPLHDGLPLFLNPDFGFTFKLSVKSLSARRNTCHNPQSSLAGEPGRPLLLQVPEFAVAFLLELRLLLDGDNVNGGLRGHRLRHGRWAWIPGSLPPGRPGE